MTTFVPNLVAPDATALWKPWATGFSGTAGTISIVNNKLSLVTGAAAAAAARVTYDDATWQFRDSIEILCKINPQQTWATIGQIMVGLRNSLTGAGGTSGIRCLLRGNTTPNVRIETLVASSATASGTANYTFTTTIAVWVRLRVADGRAMAKVWDVNTTEPVAWTVPSTAWATWDPTAGPFYPNFHTTTDTNTVAVNYRIDEIMFDNFTRLGRYRH